MIPTAERLSEIAGLDQGSLESVPFALLLRGLWQEERTVVLEIRRRQLFKRLVLERGGPVDCQSNLVHERLGRFLVSQGRLTEEAANRYLGRSIAEGVPLGNVLLAEKILTPWELYRTLQQNLAKKLLDGFSWYDGDFVLLPEVPRVESPLKVRVPQLILTGLSRFAPQREMDATVMTLIGKRIAMHPRPPVGLSELRINRAQGQLLERLDEPRSLADLEEDVGLGMDEISRYVYAFMVLGIVVSEEQLPDSGWGRPSELLATAPPSRGRPAEGASSGGEPQRSAADDARRNEIMQIYLAHRRQDAFELLGVEEAAAPAAVEKAFLAFSARVAPWEVSSSDGDDLREKAGELFLAAARAYADLADKERRETLRFQRQLRREEKERERQVGPERIKTDLLDPEVQYKKGGELLERGEYREALQFLEFASDCDPQNGNYRAELAHCRFLWMPHQVEEVSKELAEARRIDPGSGLAFLYGGDLAVERQQWQEAEQLYRHAMKIMKPDRRPIEALKEMTARRKRAR